MDTIAINHFHYGENNYLLAVDQYSGYIRVFQTQGTTTQEAYKTLLEYFMAMGFPKTIQSDYAPTFRGA